MEPRVVGIDVGKETLAIAVHPTGESWTSATTEAAIAALVTREEDDSFGSKSSAC